MRGKYFIDYLSSFTIGNPDYVSGWQATLKEKEDKGFKVAAITIPSKIADKTVEEIERLINIRCQE